jgi:adenylate kinase family enzyme
MQRIVILGCSGSGKSTLAGRIGSRLGLPVHHLDSIFWQPGWVEPDRDEFDAKVIRLALGERWVIDGNYSRTLPQRLARADTAIYLDFKRYVCLFRITRRVMTGYGTSRADMAEGCPEQLDWAFLRYVWNFPKNHRPRLMQMVDEFPGHKERLCTVRDVNAFVARLPN